MVVKRALSTGIEPSALTNRGIMNETITERKALICRTRDTGNLGTAGTINTVITAGNKMSAGTRATKGTNGIARIDLRERAKASKDADIVFCYTREGTKIALVITKSAIDAVREDITRDLGSVRTRTRGTPTTGDHWQVHRKAVTPSWLVGAGAFRRASTFLGSLCIPLASKIYP